jgi:hypothetical protein
MRKKLATKRLSLAVLTLICGIATATQAKPVGNAGTRWIADGTAPPSNGSLSYLSLKDRVVTLDYRRHRVAISETGAEVAAPSYAGTLTYPTFGQRGPPIVATTGFEVNGKPITVQVDTLYAGTLLVYPTSVGKLGLEAEAASLEVRRFPPRWESKLQSCGYLWAVAQISPAPASSFAEGFAVPAFPTGRCRYAGGECSAIAAHLSRTVRAAAENLSAADPFSACRSAGHASTTAILGADRKRFTGD